uniref:autotransporter outer membrane beta-barrel domain-containing protein n=1 Tax=Campylobacter mucosalis TaxID=202 RepID=UPI0014705E25
GNTLNIGNKNLKAKNIYNFETLNFKLPEGISNNDKMLTLTDNKSTNLKDTTVGITLAGKPLLKSGDKAILISNETGIDNQPDTPKVSATDIAATYNFDIAVDNAKQLTATLSSTTQNPAQKNLAETTIAMGAVANTAADVTEASGIKMAEGAAAMATSGSLGSFAGGDISNTRHNSGSHVDAKGISLMAGVSSYIKDDLLLGAFLEFGKGNYNSYNSFNVKGSGDTRYYGVGALSKFDLKDNIYLEGSLRFGQIRSTYEGSGFNIAINPTYKSKRAYIGTHFGVGKIIDINDNSNVDLYTKLLYSRMASDNVEINSYKYKFQAIDSLRAKLGTRYNYNINEVSKLYIGVAYEREFDSKAKAKNISANQTIKAPSMKGNTYIGELGYRVDVAKTNKNGKVVFDFNLQGLAGKKEGVAGGVNLKWEI